MFSAQEYYFQGTPFQLEENLQNVRLYLVRLLEGYKHLDCRKCSRRICYCRDYSSSPSSPVMPSKVADVPIISMDSGCVVEGDGRNDRFYIPAPSATSHLRPEWTYSMAVRHTPRDKRTKQQQPSASVNSINAWISASITNYKPNQNSTVHFPLPEKVLHEVNYSWPPLPNSIWSNEKLIETVAREHNITKTLEGDANNSVKEFFNNFKSNKDGESNEYEKV